MRAWGLDGRAYVLKLSHTRAGGADARPRSSGHLAARALLLACFPFDPLHEEVHLPGCGTDLYLDFLVAGRKLAVEVQGAQHRRFTPHFHGTPAAFAKARARDAAKAAWCAANGLTLLELDDGDRPAWPGQVRNAFLGPPPAGGDGRVGGG